MNKKIVILLLVIAPLFTNAQLGGFINKVKNKVNQKASQRIDNKVDKTIDKTLDEVEGKNAGTKPTTETADKPLAESNKTETGVKGFSKYDFIAGEKILYYDNFEQEAIAELPIGWNTNGSGEVVTLEKYPGKWLRLHKSFMYLSSNTATFDQDFTAEFDVIMQLKNNGWMFPTFSFGVFSSGSTPVTDNSLFKDHKSNAAVMVTVFPGTYNSSKLVLESFAADKNYFTSNPKDYKELEQYYGAPVHVAIQVQKERFRVWINEVKAFDVPKAVPADIKMNQLFFKVSHTNYAEEQYGFYISNIKVAAGLPDTRHKLIEEGKFSTTGILFDLNSAVIKPESYGVVKEIATVLKENPSIKIKVIGHTSSDGDDKANLELSKKRAAAVKELLATEFAVTADNIETEGKGEAQPVADNKTKEGKAANRRVEFIKL
jgi:OmpA-OmpF porin, OOP family